MKACGGVKVPRRLPGPSPMAPVPGLCSCVHLAAPSLRLSAPGFPIYLRPAQFQWPVPSPFQTFPLRSLYITVIRPMMTLCFRDDPAEGL